MHGVVHFTGQYIRMQRDALHGYTQQERPLAEAWLYHIRMN